MITIIFVRHCAAEGNVNATFQGRSDVDITPLGREQLELLALRLRNRKIDALYSSPQKRAYKTAEAVNEYHHLPIATDDGLMEIDMGEMDGMKWADMPLLYPRAAELWSGRAELFAAPGGESMAQVAARVQACVARLVERENKPGGERVACVITHGTTLRCALCGVHGWPLSRISDVPLSDNTAISEVRFGDDGSCTVLREGDASHLADGMSVLGKLVLGTEK